MRGTKENLKQFAAKPLAQWLIHAANRGSTITYGGAKRRLESEVGFDTIFPPMMGVPAGELMYRILAVEPDSPLLNILLVRQDDRMPSDGAGQFMADYLNDEMLGEPEFRVNHPDEWRSACGTIASDVYTFNDWDRVYRRAFRERLPKPVPEKYGEKDGLDNIRKGEGLNHKALRLWVKNNPGQIKPAYSTFRTDTEVILDSADRVDVVYFGRRKTVVIEVKSSDSDEGDLRRGVFQCIKYRAVMKAMNVCSNPDVNAILVTQTDLPGDLDVLCRLNRIEHFKAPRL